MPKLRWGGRPAKSRPRSEAVDPELQSARVTVLNSVAGRDSIGPPGTQILEGDEENGGSRSPTRLSLAWLHQIANEEFLYPLVHGVGVALRQIGPCAVTVEPATSSGQLGASAGSPGSFRTSTVAP